MACEGWDDSDPARSGIYTVRASDGTTPRRLTEARDVPCDYSPDGTQLAFVRTGDEDTVGTLMVMDAGGGTPRSLAPNIALSGIACDWSPDGQAIVAGSADGTLLMVSPDGEGTPFSGDGIDGYAWGAVWSPDGTRLLFSMAPEGGDSSAAFIAARDGSDLVRITDPGGYEEADAWLA
jgi:Tol biopolymer transport system component